MSESQLRKTFTNLQPNERNFVKDFENTSFVGGVLTVAGVLQQPVSVQNWLSSNNLTQYTTVAWRDPIAGFLRATCNCPGWTYRTERACCHTKDMIGEAVCRKEKVGEPEKITTPAEAVARIPDIMQEHVREIIWS